VDVELAQHGADLAHHRRVDRQRHVPGRVHGDTSRAQVRMIQPAMGVRDDHLVEVGEVRHEPGATPRSRGGQFGVQVAARAQLVPEANRQAVGEQRTRVRRPQGDQGVHPLVTAQPLHVVPGDQAAQTVPDDVDPFIPGSGHQFLDRAGQVPRRRADVIGDRGVVDREHPAEATAAQPAAEHREDHPIVDHAVQQQDRRPGRLDVPEYQATLVRREIAQVIALAHLVPVGDHPERVEGQVDRAPQRLDGGASHGPERGQRPQVVRQIGQARGEDGAARRHESRPGPGDGRARASPAAALLRDAFPGAGTGSAITSFSHGSS